MEPEIYVVYFMALFHDTSVIVGALWPENVDTRYDYSYRGRKRDLVSLCWQMMPLHPF